MMIDISEKLPAAQGLGTIVVTIGYNKLEIGFMYVSRTGVTAADNMEKLVKLHAYGTRTADVEVSIDLNDVHTGDYSNTIKKVCIFE